MAFDRANIQREHKLANLLNQYDSQLNERKQLPDNTLLDQAWTLLQERLNQPTLDEEVVHLGIILCHKLKERETPIRFLSRYLTQSLPLSEGTWAKWELVDHLALAHRYEEMIKTQKEFLHWALRNTPLQDICRVMNDATQALGWVALGQGEEWMHIFHDLLPQVEATETNRFDRFCYFRTAGVVCSELKRTDEVLSFGERIRQIAQEDPSWEKNYYLIAEASHLQMKAYQQLGRIDELRQLGIETAHFIEEQREVFLSTINHLPGDFWIRYHNLGAQFYFAGQYDLAIAQFRRSLNVHEGTSHAYLWLAASLWITTKNRNEVLSLLRSAAHLHAGGKSWCDYRDLPEFQDVRDDPQFLQTTLGTQ
ncbi:hypothetical protein [Dictyobacter formicarum]|uniref:Tetratricopeptide repeat protein n=1 Tax=Dictyobacter formicarum TaxID=2778368 RepID=A0ABQ3VAX4_9CHLR|nr:hypothetical protein [Dictyobacter formicarum]GHO83300.1 hypothetical protein KSZ_13060 [Dictyobacter formicarum]